MKITMSFEDNKDGTVAVECTPDAKKLFLKYKQKSGMSPAEAMALVSMSAAIRSSQEGDFMDRVNGKGKIILA